MLEAAPALNTDLTKPRSDRTNGSESVSKTFPVGSITRGFVMSTPYLPQGGEEPWRSTKARIMAERRWRPGSDTSHLEAQLAREVAEARKERLVKQAREILEKYSESGSPE